MTDMLVNLYTLPEDWPSIGSLIPPGITLRKPLVAEKSLVILWIRENFGDIWANEAETAFSRLPLACFIAQQGMQIVGFACYDATALGYFGPTGVDEDFRGLGIGKALLLAALLDMKLKGYGYAIIGWIGPQEFYAKTVGAMLIPNSTPGIWKNWLLSDVLNEDEEE